jgi:HD-GYP domain-containing protein (c-di-GMP phosphodiesterase class II)
MQDWLERVERLNEIGVALSAESDHTRLLERILEGAKDLTAADGGTLYLVRPDGSLAFEIMRTDSLGVGYGGSQGAEVPFEPLALYVDGHPDESMVVTHAVLRRETVTIADAYAAEGFDFSGTRAFDARTGYRTRSLLCVPMADHEDEVIGVLQLINATGDGGIVEFGAADRRLVESLASQAAIALSNRSLLDQLRALFESFVQLIADAIDAKSPYTGAHCRRVPELTMMLADAAHASAEGPLAAFTLSANERYALYLAGWLHDCGKITTPEHVIDKATKLETVHDRIDTVAARFAACRQAVLAAHEPGIAVARAQGETAAAAAAEAARDTELARLSDELAFVQRLNRGDEPMNDAARARVERIAGREWVDAGGHPRALLSADELANLTIQRGTLNARERAIVEHHAVASIDMLEQLPFPAHLQQVPEYAGGHHERCDGQGYPNGLTREEMSIPARAMAIADVFEALSAADRPYKPAKPLSQCLAIMRAMRDEGHIDPDLFAVFVNAGVYQDYARRHLRPEQIDTVDRAAVLEPA